VGFDTGIIGNAAKFIAASSQSLSLTSILLAPDFTLSFWLYHENPAGTSSAVMYVAGNDLSTIQVAVSLQGDGSAIAAVADTLGNIGFSIAPISGAGWHHIVVTFSESDKTPHLYVDLVDPTAELALTATSHYAVATPLSFGGENTGIGLSGYLTGRLDEAYIFSEAKNSAWRTDIYNGGAGRAYPN
jgi:hypothetical protein